MNLWLQFFVYLLVALLAILLGVVLGDYAPWYFAWLVGTVMLVLVAAAGGAWFDAQEAEQDQAR